MSPRSRSVFTRLCPRGLPTAEAAERDQAIGGTESGGLGLIQEAGHDAATARYGARAVARALVTRDRPPTPVRLAEPHGTDPDETREGHQAAGRSARVRDETWEDYVLGTDRTTCTCGCGCDFGVRLLAVRKHAYGYDYAWCFPRDPEAVESAVAAWHPEMRDEPVGWHKRPMNPPTAADCVLAPSGLAVGAATGEKPARRTDALKWSRCRASPARGTVRWHARRAPLRVRLCVVDRGTIPAYAGSTALADRPRPGWRDHPRIRGEHRGFSRPAGPRTGPSPHARGAPGRAAHRAPPPGTIPACAGSTGVGVRVDVQERDHPHMRGEHVGPYSRAKHKEGPSPHARGALMPAVPGRCRSGTIPACAGSTAGAAHRPVPGRGPSPHARGARHCTGSASGGGGTIPACAGSTARPWSRSAEWRDHPRMRGEHTR